MTQPELIKKLLDPNVYDDAANVELRQTHISYVLLAGKFAYKIKKCVNFGFLDFSTLEKRRFMCEEELRLNRRLATDVYLCVEPVTIEDGRARMGGKGEPVEYAVKMLRLSDDTMLDELIRRDAVTPDVIGRVTRKIAEFHKRSETNGRISAYGRPSAIKKNTDDNLAMIASHAGLTVSQRLFDAIKTYTDNFIKDNEPLFLRRIDGGFIRECHGDIHCEHVSVGESVNIYDCIEFNERFRFSDVAADLAFLSMDLDFHNRHDLDAIMTGEYFAATGDDTGAELMNFYRCYRAAVRGKVEGLKAGEDEVGADERLSAIVSARHHFRLAGAYADGGHRPLLIIMRGLSGTGKSTLAYELKRETGMAVFSSDAIRKELAGIPLTERGGTEIYSREFSARTYAEMTRRGIDLIKQGRSVILDATFPKREYIDIVRYLSLEAGLRGGDIHIIESRATDDIVRRNMQRRTTEPAVSDADWNIYQMQKDGFEDLNGGVIIADGSKGLSENLLNVSAKIFD